jgi:hypothetical protein
MQNIYILFLLASFSSYAQITTTNIAKEKTIKKVYYDSLSNFLNGDYHNYIGQNLFLLGKNKELRKYGYEGFVIDKNYKKYDYSDISNVYKCKEGYNSEYSKLAEKYFKVIAVFKNEEALGVYQGYLQLVETTSNDTLYYIYDGMREGYKFPFLVLGFFEKQKKILIGKEFVFCDEYLSSTHDIVTGNLITNKLGQKWKCYDLSVTKDYYKLSLLLTNELDEKVAVSLDNILGEHSKGRVYHWEVAESIKKNIGQKSWISKLQYCE